jgi:hypothetical protein
VKLFHLSGRPRSWTLYNFMNFAYLLLSHSKNLVYRTLYVGSQCMSKTSHTTSRGLFRLFDY